MDTFFNDDDYKTYLALLTEWCATAGTEIWAYCLMPNHVHLVLLPSSADGLRGALSETHRRYTRHVNGREGWRGHLWQERFHSFPMDGHYLLACARYVELNPVRAKLVRQPHRWPWSSAKAHLSGKDDGVVAVAPLLGRVDDWKTFLQGGLEKESLETIRAHGRTGYPLGSKAFLRKLGRSLGRGVAPRKPGRPKKTPA